MTKKLNVILMKCCLVCTKVDAGTEWLRITKRPQKTHLHPLRLKEEDSQNAYMQATQVAQNKMLRLLDNTTLADRKHTADLLKNAKMLSVNQLAASIKLTEAWKSCNVPNYPIQLEKKQWKPDSHWKNRQTTDNKTLERGWQDIYSQRQLHKKHCKIMEPSSTKH